MGMDATMILISKEIDKIEELCRYFNEIASLDRSYKEDEDIGLTHLSFYDSSDLMMVDSWYVVKYELRKVLEDEIYERMRQDKRIDLLNGACLVYCNDYSDQLFARRYGEDEVRTEIGDYVEKEIYTRVGFDEIPLKEIFKEVCGWEDVVYIQRK